ncbi:hypothetical protein VF14_18775 [Nostoc linckia z18]|uniref:Uncharacterized protein n=2 Tax=Nostoc linckia TaxID=92942 RepID=A0A9Q5ZBE8_NOSLI|nr:hypothetical protein VF02_27495 [Nostoc linckia z1]PHJ60740.1 hypothetical protein VF05_29905 [Nostoc linckia z3]PHJ65759.1 hypothetical protein VF03_27405 [Nostoc linckia z2]PHJ77345.1 hypothetical protein VF06_30245 [Nostoc linckia z4]PHJ81846.1 hypothetical protein VF07_29530 [Nostoc linckia z6]PHJ94557.1 hypothetical protein VF04_22000 [Nostoc linckia z7]PHK02880.1 hypothetical protein VF08_17125 [Nostoc linckia z8]PHK09437.1 hypothetical protein VF09_15455 [Nostoc linckia z9]PHK1943
MLITPVTKAGLAVSKATKPAIQQKLKQKVTAMNRNTRNLQLNDKSKHRRGFLWRLRQLCRFWHPILGAVIAIASLMKLLFH